jgi:hypothetical protein
MAPGACANAHLMKASAASDPSLTVIRAVCTIRLSKNFVYPLVTSEGVSRYNIPRSFGASESSLGIGINVPSLVVQSRD